MFALSTSWNNARNRNGKHVVRDIKKIGFNAIELGFSHTRSQLAQIKSVKNVDILSLHNYCPIPEKVPYAQALPDCFNLASPHTSLRKTAIAYTKRSIRTAKKFKARVLVIHCGRVEMPDYTKQLFALKSRCSASNNKKFIYLKCQALRQRKKIIGKFFDNILKSLKELQTYAYNEGVILGIENRNYLREIPNFKEIGILISTLGTKGIGYWHDTGHAFLLQKLGMEKHTHYLKRYHRYLCGFHLHDVKGFRDHRAPFTGEIDFSLFKPYLKKKHIIKIIEVHKPTGKREIILAREKLEKLITS